MRQLNSYDNINAVNVRITLILAASRCTTFGLYVPSSRSLEEDFPTRSRGTMDDHAFLVSLKQRCNRRTLVTRTITPTRRNRPRRSWIYVSFHPKGF